MIQYFYFTGIVHSVRDDNALTRMQYQTQILLKDVLPKETGFDAGYITTGAIFITRDKEQLDGFEKKGLV